MANNITPSILLNLSPSCSHTCRLLGLLITSLSMVYACSWFESGVLAQQVDKPTTTAKSSLPEGMQRRTVEGIENFIQVSDRVYSGGEPNQAGLEYLKSIGITLLLSVDGLSPDRAAAEKLGLKYVHVPMGYDGIHSAEMQDFVTLMAHYRGKIFVHCHHGKHRGPAAVAACLVISKEMTKDQATQFMHGAGTSKDYIGLWKSIEELDATQYEPQDFSKLLLAKPDKSLAQWMAELDRAWEIIQFEQKNPQASLSAEQLTLIAEAFRESSRLAKKAPENEYGDQAGREYVVHGLEESAKETQTILELSQAQAHEKARDFIKSLAKKCTECHAQYRN